MSDLPNRILERYDLVERIAVGGMAEVFLAKAYGPHGFEKTLAIKRILPELAASPEFEERFIDEANLAVKLTHTNIVQVFDFGRFGDSLFIAMEYVDGLDLAALLKICRERGEQLPLPAAFQIAIDIARGLDFAHAHGVIHRDVSPSNILLSRAGEVKIADFGIALAGTEELAKSAHRRRIMGKWRYMSPEQTRGESLETRSDLFAAAAVMYELFVGEKLFPGDEVDEIVENIHQMEIPDASAMRPGMPAQLDQILRRALARPVHERPAHAAEMQRALTEISYASRIVATPLDVAEAFSRVWQDSPSASDEKRAPRKQPIDHFIRRQLASVDGDGDRQTAVSPSDPGENPNPEPVERRPATMVRTGIGEDGMPVWKLRDGPQTQKSATGSDGEATRKLAREARRRYFLAFAMLAALASVAWIVRENGSSDEALAEPIPMIDGSVELPIPTAEPGILTITSEPARAQIWIDRDKLDAMTPTSTPVSPGQPLRIMVTMAGYRPEIRDDVIVEAGDNRSLSVQLEPLPASLIVRSQPPGALVKLGGHTVGRTPTVIDNVDPGPDQLLTLSKTGHQVLSLRVDVPAGGRVVVERTLIPLSRPRPPPQPVRRGYIDLHIQDSWAVVYLGTKKIGQAPAKGLELPEGTHRLRLYNPVSKRQRFIVVEVVANVSKYYSVGL
ncbi:MAG: protein kinase [Proteobacteria bacterium]|nr:protein kinase [Pseudomonadota bacterium]